jgi:hypothetical protein
MNVEHRQVQLRLEQVEHNQGLQLKLIELNIVNCLNHSFRIINFHYRLVNLNLIFIHL